MRILICIPCLLTGGTEIQTLSLAEALVGGGHEVGVACYFESEASMRRRYEEAGARVWTLSSPTDSDAKRPAGTAATWRFLRRGLGRVIREFRPDVAHVQYMAPGALAILALRSLGISKIVATSHTAADIYSERALKLLRLISNHILSAFQCITLRAEEGYFNSSSLLCDKKHFSRKGNHFTVHNNIPSHIRIAEKERTGSPTSIGVVSRLEHIKGMDLVIPAFAQVARRHPDLKLIVAGSGSLRAEMEDMAHKLGLTDKQVEFLGRIEQSRLNETYDKIDILLMPSRSEGFGLTAVEGMARGCVPVVANTGGLPEVLGNSDCGLLHDPGDAEDIAAKIEYILSKPDAFPQMSKAALKRAECFSANEYSKQINSMYQRLFADIK